MKHLLPVALTLILTFSSLVGCSEPGEAPHAVDGKVYFSFHHESGNEVFLTGDFAGWESRAIPMVRDEKGVWQAIISLPVGFHEYKFVVDDNWVPDPSKKRRHTGRGPDCYTLIGLKGPKKISLEYNNEVGDPCYQQVLG